MKGVLSATQINISQISSGRRALIKLPLLVPVGVGVLGKEDGSEIDGRGGTAATYSPHTDWVSQRLL